MNTANNVDTDGECTDGEQQSCADEYGVVYFAHRRGEETAHHKREAQQEADIKAHLSAVVTFGLFGHSFSSLIHCCTSKQGQALSANSRCPWIADDGIW